MKKTGIIALIISVISLCCSGVCIFMLLQKPPVPEDAKTTESSVQSSDSEESTEKSNYETTTQYVMYVGTNDKDTYKPKHTNEEAKKSVDEICLKYFEGYTLQDATGSWTDEKKNITHEYTLVCYFDGADDETVHKAADEVIKALNQNTVLIEQDEIKIEFYSRK